MMLELEGVSRHFGKTKALNGLCVHVPRGKIYGFLGRNGAGKTTTIRIALGLIRAHGGVVRIGGKPLGSLGLRRIGSIVEFPGFYPNLDGADNLRIFQWLHGIQDPGTVRRAMDRVGLSEAGGKKTGAYSQGMKQRLGIARALLHDPDVLILDEPVNGLDPSGIRDVRTLLRSLSRDFGKTIFLSSHILSEIEQIVDVVGIVHRGKMMEEIPIDLLKKRCSRGLLLKTSDRDGAAEFLRERLGVECAAAPDGALSLREDADAAAVNKLLVDNGFHVSMLMESSESLEEYFLRLTA